LLAVALPAAAQCSDNGVCGLERPGAGAGPAWGLSLLDGRSGGLDGLRIRTLRAEGSLGTEGGARLSFALPFHRISGPLGVRAGMGDLVLVWDHPLGRAGAFLAAGQMGLSLGTGRADGAPGLPQAYQTGLGGTDFLAGLRLEGGGWRGGLGFQRAGGRSPNPLTRLRRGDDLSGWLEGERPVGAARVALKAGLIQRLGRSSVLDPSTGTFVDLPGSAFAQANLTIRFTLPLKGGRSLGAEAVVPLSGRRTNEDGSKRALTLSVGVRGRF
jgi:hypothetical protein